MSVFTTIKFLPEVLKQLRRMETAAPKAIARGMRGWAEQTRTAAIRVTPKHIGGLRGSIFVKQEGNQVTIGAGGPTAPYAVAVHEHVSKHSPQSWLLHQIHGDVKWSTPGTGAKFIENPVVERMPKLKQDLSSELEKALQGK